MDCHISNCGGGISLGPGADATVLNTTIESCGTAVDVADGAELETRSVKLIGNRTGVRNAGVFIAPDLHVE